MASAMGEAQWITVHIINSLASDSLKIKGAWLKWGKFHEDGNKDAEITTDQVNSITIPPGSSANVNSCGRASSPSGTEGGFDIYDGEIKVCGVYWSCPWGSPDNTFEIKDKAKGYYVEVGNWNRKGGAIGTVDVEIGKKG